MNKDDEKKVEDEKKTPETQEKEPAQDKEKASEEKPAPKVKQPEEKLEPKQPEQSENGQKSAPREDESSDTPDNSAEFDKLKAENLRLTAQLEAIKAGFSPDLTEEAVLLAENIAAKEGVEIKDALQKVTAKFPEWKRPADERKKEKKGGIRVGAPSSDKPPEEKPKQLLSQKRWNRFN